MDITPFLHANDVNTNKREVKNLVEFWVLMALVKIKKGITKGKGLLLVVTEF